MHQRGNKHSQKGDCLSICLSCSTANLANRKRKCVESNSDHAVKQLATQPHMSPSQFMDALAKCASTTEIDDSWHIPVDEMTLTDKGIASHLASLAWEATGYRFT